MFLNLSSIYLVSNILRRRDFNKCLIKFDLEVPLSRPSIPVTEHLAFLQSPSSPS